MGASRKGATGSPESGLGWLVWATAPAHPLFEMLYAVPTTITRAAPFATTPRTKTCPREPRPAAGGGA